MIAIIQKEFLNTRINIYLSNSHDLKLTNLFECIVVKY